MMKSPFLFKKTPSIRSKYCFCVNENVYSNPLSGAGVLETIPPLPVNDLVFAAPNKVALVVALFWNPEIIAALSTLGLKSITYVQSNQMQLQFFLKEHQHQVSILF